LRSRSEGQEADNAEADQPNPTKTQPNDIDESAVGLVQIVDLDSSFEVRCAMRDETTNVGAVVAEGRPGVSEGR
jgi:hypothetical protein